MSQKEINTVGDLAEKVLQKNPERPLSSTYFGIFCLNMRKDVQLRIWFVIYVSKNRLAPRFLLSLAPPTPGGFWCWCKPSENDEVVGEGWWSYPSFKGSLLEHEHLVQRYCFFSICKYWAGNLKTNWALSMWRPDLLLWISTLTTCTKTVRSLVHSPAIWGFWIQRYQWRGQLIGVSGEPLLKRMPLSMCSLIRSWIFFCILPSSSYQPEII